MEEKYGLQRQHSGIWRSLRSDGDFEEEEVWDVLKEKPPHYNNNTNNNNSYGVFKSKSKYFSSSSSFVSLSVPRPLPSASKMIPKAISSNNITSSPSIESKLLQQSAPVHIPDWSKIYKNNNNKMKNNHNNKAHNRWVSRVEDYDDDSVDDDEDNEGDINGEEDEDEDEEEDDDDVCDVKLPPHEIISRRLARNQISSFSVFEGVGRTLKGRDLSKVRNAVLTKTGFLESL